MIKDLKAGERGKAPFYCQKVTNGVTRTNKPYQSAVLRDATGSIDAKIWDVSKCSMEEDAYYGVAYEVQEYSDKLQLKIEGVTKFKKEDVNPADFYPTSKYDTDAMFKEIIGMLNTVDNQWLQALLRKFFNDKELVKKFKSSSAAVGKHHAFVGGLMQHTKSIMGLAQTAALQYEGVDRGLLLTAAFFHDVGKLKEISAFPKNDFTAFGVMIGHVTLSALMVEHWCSEIEGFPEELKIRLMHCLLAHHGELEWGSPVKPALREAIILSHLDNLDAKLEMFEEASSIGGGYVSTLGTTVLNDEKMKCLETGLIP